MASFRDPNFLCRFHRLKDPIPRKRVRDPPHTRNFPHCVKKHRHLAATAGGCRYGGCLVYVVEGHASACPQTVGVDVKYVALTLIKLKREVSASIMRPNKNVDLLFHCYLVLVNTIYYFIQFGGIRTHF